MDAPDVWMDKDIGDVINRGIQRLHRLKKFEKLRRKVDQDPKITDMAELCFRKEKEMCKNIGFVLRARFSEVISFCTDILLLDNVTEELVKSDPYSLLFCCDYQIDRLNMLMDAREAADG